MVVYNEVENNAADAYPYDTTAAGTAGQEYDLQDIRQAQEEALEAQRPSFQMELERLEKTWNEKSKLLKNEIKLLRNSKPYSALKVAELTLEKKLDQGTHANTNRLRPSSEGPGENPHPRLSSNSPATNNRDGSTVLKPISGIKSTKPTPKSYAQIAAFNVTQSASNNLWTEIMGNNRKRKGNAASPPKMEPEKRRLIFRRQANLPQKSGADLMLVLNESLQKTGAPSYIRFIRMGYSQLGAISGLLTERSNAEDLIKQHSNTLIRAAKSIDEGVIGVEALERWHRLKVHAMPLLRYFGEGRIEILSREIESSTGIKLKTTPRWLVSKAQLEKRLDTGDARGLAIVIRVGSEEEVSKLCAKGLRFRGALKVVEKYWEAKPSSVCMTCSGIGLDRLGGCNQRPEQCVICAGAHKSENHKCVVMGSTAKRGKICVHVVPKCANCRSSHQATVFRCPARRKAHTVAWKNKEKKAENGKERESSAETEALVESHEECKSTPKPVKIKLDINSNWAQSPAHFSDLSSIEDNAPENSQDLW